MTIAKAFGIPYLVIHDEDPLPDPIPDVWDADKRKGKGRTFNLNNEIAQLVEAPLGEVRMFRPDFEGACGVSKSQGDKKGKALAALEHFEGLPTGEIPEALNAIVVASYPAA